MAAAAAARRRRRHRVSTSVNMQCMQFYLVGGAVRDGLLGLAVRGYFSLYHLMAVSFAPQLAQVVTDRLVARMFPSVAFAGLAVLLLLIDILFIPGDRWVNEPAA